MGVYVPNSGQQTMDIDVHNGEHEGDDYTMLIGEKDGSCDVTDLELLLEAKCSTGPDDSPELNEAIIPICCYANTFQPHKQFRAEMPSVALQAGAKHQDLGTSNKELVRSML